MSVQGPTVSGPPRRLAEVCGAGCPARYAAPAASAATTRSTWRPVINAASACDGEHVYGAGFRHRPLAYDAPVGTTGSTVDWGKVEENAATVGISAPFAYDRALVTIFGQQASRNVGGEKAFALGIGLTVRP